MVWVGTALVAVSTFMLLWLAVWALLSGVVGTGILLLALAGMAGWCVVEMVKLNL